MTAIQRHSTTSQWLPAVVRSSSRQEEEEHHQKPSGKTIHQQQQQDWRLRHGFLVALVATVIVLIGVHSSWSFGFMHQDRLSSSQHYSSSSNDHDDGPVTRRTTKPILLMGLPKSGSEAIHEFIQCMNGGEENVTLMALLLCGGRGGGKPRL
jgi:hypothetical protein